jgi:hypothetical protein
MDTAIDCGATSPPNLEARANSSFQWIGLA